VVVTISRVGDADLAFLAMDRGPVPEQLGVVLLLDGVLDADACVRLLSERVSAVPRLRQRLMPTPLGCGPPIWAEDPSFDVRRHFSTATCPAPSDAQARDAGRLPSADRVSGDVRAPDDGRMPGDDRALADAAMPELMRRLPRDRPLWRAVLISGAEGGTSALLLILHHALADGLGGLAVLSHLLDDADSAPHPKAGEPTTMPHRPAVYGAKADGWRLAADAWRRRGRAIRAAPGRLRRLGPALRAGGGIKPAPVADCSLLQPVGGRRRAVVVRAPLDALRDAGHRHDAGINSVLLAAVAGALRRLLDGRGERLGAVSIAVPVGAQRAAGGAQQAAGGTGRAAGRAAGGVDGNLGSPLVVTVPDGGDGVAHVAAEVRRRRGEAAGPAPVAVLGGAFRVLASMGAYGWYMRRQRRMHTLVSNVRGPGVVVSVGGVSVRGMIPLVVGGNTNITVMFLALSYCGELVVTVVADPDRCPDLDRLGVLLSGELDLIVRA
jgi:WS/DGAT/MGAT family acyltransferase